MIDQEVMMGVVGSVLGLGWLMYSLNPTSLVKLVYKVDPF